jgi:hypothetical protein
MQIIEIQTLVDITNTKITRPRIDLQFEHDQYRNFITLKQCVEIRSIITYDTDPIMEVKDLKDLGFGSKFKGKQAVWRFRFSPDRSGVYSDNIDEIGCLINDLHEVPIIKNLKETINIEKSIFDLKNETTKNTIIKALKGAI